MSIRLESLRQVLRKERAGLMNELDAHMQAVTDIRKAMSAIDSILGDKPERAQPRPAQAGESDNARLTREKNQIRDAIVRELKANPEGLATDELVNIIQNEPGVGEMSPFRIGQIARQMRERGQGIIGDGDLWIWVPGAGEGADDPDNNTTGA